MSKRILVPSTKDSSGAYVKPDLPQEGPAPAQSLDEIIRRQYIILERETTRLLHESASGLLTKEGGVAFERCVKIAREFKKEEREFLESLSDEELAELEKLDK